ncbi:hypothetical protein GCM10018965_039990 [Nonomuraea roseola]
MASLLTGLSPSLSVLLVGHGPGRALAQFVGGHEGRGCSRGRALDERGEGLLPFPVTLLLGGIGGAWRQAGAGHPDTVARVGLEPSVGDGGVVQDDLPAGCGFG